MNLDRERDDQRFIDHLEELAGWKDGTWDERRVDRAALAALRRAAGKPPDQAATAHRYVGEWLDPADLERDGGWPASCLYLVASLFAMHPRASWARREGRGQWWERNLGASFHRLAPPGDHQRESVDRRFQWLLASDRHELPGRLRQAITLLAGAHQNVPVDWFYLLRDLRWWGREGGRVQTHWAAAFWRGVRDAEDAAADADGDTPDAVGDDEDTEEE